MAKSKYRQINALIEYFQEGGDSVSLLEPIRTEVKPIVYETGTHLEKYVIKGAHFAYDAINGGGRVVIHRDQKAVASKLVTNSTTQVWAFSKSTRPNDTIELRVRDDGCLNTLSTGKGGGFASSLNVVRYGDKLRCLTPLECERLMGWPDEWTKWGLRDGKRYLIPESKRYFMCGNGIVSSVSKQIHETYLWNEGTLATLSTFSGVDGSCLGIPKKSKRLIAFCEFAEKPSDVLAYNYEGSVNLGDVRDPSIKEIRGVDLFFTSPPCQAWSTAGNQQGPADPRGDLVFETVRIIAHVKPRFVIFENVKNLAHYDDGKILKSIVCGLVEMGYSVKLDVLNANDFGSPQKRERVFILATYIGHPKKEVDDGIHTSYMTVERAKYPNSKNENS